MAFDSYSIDDIPFRTKRGPINTREALQRSFEGATPKPDLSALAQSDKVGLAHQLGFSHSEMLALGSSGLDALKENATRSAMIARGSQALEDEATKRDIAERQRGMQTPDVVKLLGKDTPGVAEAHTLVEGLGKTQAEQGKALMKQFSSIGQLVRDGKDKEAINAAIDLIHNAKAMDIAHYPEIGAQRGVQEQMAKEQAARAGAAPAAGAEPGVPPTPGAQGAQPDTSDAAISSALGAGTAKGSPGPAAGTVGPTEKLVTRYLFGPMSPLPDFLREQQLRDVGMLPADTAAGAKGQSSADAVAQAKQQGQLSVASTPGGSAPPAGQPVGPLAGGAHVDPNAPQSFSQGAGGELTQQGAAQPAMHPNVSLAHKALDLAAMTHTSQQPQEMAQGAGLEGSPPGGVGPTATPQPTPTPTPPPAQQQAQQPAPSPTPGAPVQDPVAAARSMAVDLASRNVPPDKAREILLQQFPDLGAM